MSRNRHCFVPGCDTGYARAAESTDNYSLFRPPANRLSLWAHAIPRSDRQLTVRDRVCELHFEPHHIVRNFEVGVGSDTVVFPRQKPLLHKDAVPCIFPDLPSELSRVTKLPRRQIKKVPVCTTSLSSSSDADVSNVDATADACITYSDLVKCHS